MTPRHLSGESGQVTAFLVTFIMALLFVAGLVIDGGYLLAAKRQAIDTAEQAARAGAQGLALEDLRATGRQTLDPRRATLAARAYLASTGHDGTVTVNGDRVAVTVTIPRRLVILGIAGFGEVTVTGQAEARNVRGVLRAET